MNSSVTIELISTFTCSRCVSAQKQVQDMIKKLNLDNINYKEVSVLEQIDYVVQLGVLKTPAIAINGKLVFTSIPTFNQFHKALELVLEKHVLEKYVLEKYSQEIKRV